MLDYSSSSTGVEFYDKSVYSQPTNIASAAVGMVAGYFVGLTTVGFLGGAVALGVVIAVGWVAGLVTQWAIIETGYDVKTGNFLKIEN